MADAVPGGLLDRVANRRMARQLNPMREALLSSMPQQGFEAAPPDLANAGVPSVPTAAPQMLPQQAMIAAAARDPSGIPFADLARRTEGGALALGAAMQQAPRSREIVVHPEDELNTRLGIGLKDRESVTLKLDYDSQDRQLPGFEITQYKTSADNTEAASGTYSYPSGPLGQVLYTQDLRKANGMAPLSPEEVQNIFNEARMTSTDQQAYRRYRDQQLAAGVPESEIPDEIDFRMTSNAGSQFAGAVGVAESARIKDYQDKAVDAVKSMPAILNAYELIDQGIISGPGAEPRLALVRALDIMLGREHDAKSAATDAYLINRGKDAAVEIKNFGAGTGLSDADRDFANMIVAGKITMTPQALRMALEILARGRLGEVVRYNTQKQNLTGNFALMRPFLQDVQVPETIYSRISPLAKAPENMSDEDKAKFYFNQRPSYMPQGANQQLPPNGGQGPAGGIGQVPGPNATPEELVRYYQQR